jgi:hypothetical protein
VDTKPSPNFIGMCLTLLAFAAQFSGYSNPYVAAAFFGWALVFFGAHFFIKREPKTASNAVSSPLLSQTALVAALNERREQADWLARNSSGFNSIELRDRRETFVKGTYRFILQHCSIADAEDFKRVDTVKRTGGRLQIFSPSEQTRFVMRQYSEKLTTLIKRIAAGQPQLPH